MAQLFSIIAIDRYSPQIVADHVESALWFWHFLVSPALSQVTLMFVEIGGKPQFCQPGLVLGPEFGVTFPSWFASSVSLSDVCLLSVVCVMCLVGG